MRGSEKNPLGVDGRLVGGGCEAHRRSGFIAQTQAPLESSVCARTLRHFMQSTFSHWTKVHAAGSVLAAASPTASAVAPSAAASLRSDAGGVRARRDGERPAAIPTSP